MIANVTSLPPTLNTVYSDCGGGPWDTILLSEDGLQFYVHQSRLLNASKSYFNGLLLPYLGHELLPETTPPCLQLSENSAIVDVLLHIIYDIPLQQHGSTLGALLETVKALEKYGLPFDIYLVPGSSLFEDIVLKTSYKPLDVYAVAAEHDLFEMACRASEHLLNLPLVFISEAMVQRLGITYMHMLYNLHLGRMYVLQRLVMGPPESHEPVLLCGVSNYETLKAAWSVAVCELLSKASPGMLPALSHLEYSQMNVKMCPDIPQALIRSTFEPVQFLTTCQKCQLQIQRRIDEIVLKWSITPVSLKSGSYCMTGSAHR